MQVQISSKRVVWFLFFLNCIFLIGHVVYVLVFYGSLIPHMHLVWMDRINMDAEVSIPTWFAQILLFLISALALLIGCAIRKARKEDAKYWIGIGLIALYMSIDEGAALHELLAAPVRDLLQIHSGPFVFAWVIPALIVVSIITVVYMRFILRLPRKIGLFFILAAGIFVLGAVGMELISAWHWRAQGESFDRVYGLLTGVEEFLENTGSILGIYALLLYMTTAQFRSLRAHIRIM